MRRGALVTMAVVVVLLSAAPAAAISTGPVYADDFPDPSVLVVGSTYWAYSTGSAGRNLQAISSPDLKTWTRPVDPLPVLPYWARPGHTWAPDVLPLAGAFLMYYTVRDGGSGRQCVSVAVASAPVGPFTDTSSGPLVCQVSSGGSIDASPVVTSAGTYLVWKSDDNALGRRTHLWSQRLSSDGRSLVGSRSLLLSADAPWQGSIIEGPSMVETGGLFYLFYGGNAWDSAKAGIGYGWCLSPLGPCINASILGPWMASHGTGYGPSGPEVFVDASGATRLAYHSWTGAVGYTNGGVRSLWVAPLSLVALFPSAG